ncbi:MAG: MotA/TolQ/ExbB proton channel family protein [Psychrobacter sp.]|nr:MotA/TolQ/ExbB proton channel family protein [Psychrobacter sp.]
MDFAAYWQYTDIITKALFFILLGLSILTWVTGILRLIYSRKLAQSVAEELRQTLATIRSNPTDYQAFSFEQKKTMSEQALLQQIGRYRYRGDQGLSILGTTAAIAPFIGLFGTVWGIFHALHNIGESGQAGLSQVAGPVGEALIMTGLGLVVAIPAVIFYNLGTRMNKKTLYLAHDTAYELLGNTASNPKPLPFNSAPSSDYQPSTSSTLQAKSSLSSRSGSAS